MEIDAFLPGPLARLYRRRALRRFAGALSTQLRADYGHGGPYTPLQVERSIERAGAAPARTALGLALFCTAEALQGLQPPPRFGPSFPAMQAEIAGLWFGGSAFTPMDVHHLCAHQTGGELCLPVDGDGGSHHVGSDAGAHH